MLLKKYQFRQLKDKGLEFLAEMDLKEGKIVPLEEAINIVERPSKSDLKEFADITGFNDKTEKNKDASKYL